MSLTTVARRQPLPAPPPEFRPGSGWYLSVALSVVALAVAIMLIVPVPWTAGSVAGDIADGLIRFLSIGTPLGLTVAVIGLRRHRRGQALFVHPSAAAKASVETPHLMFVMDPRQRAAVVFAVVCGAAALPVMGVAIWFTGGQIMVRTPVLVIALVVALIAMPMGWEMARGRIVGPRLALTADGVMWQVMMSQVRVPWRDITALEAESAVVDSAVFLTKRPVTVRRNATTKTGRARQLDEDPTTRLSLGIGLLGTDPALTQALLAHYVANPADRKELGRPTGGPDRIAEGVLLPPAAT